MITFQSLNLPAPIQEALVRMQYEQPTEIQAKAIPIAMAGHDILGSAQTGTGKTAAFGIPLVNKLIEDPQATALILTPTRELAEQVVNVLHQLLNKRRDIKTALLIGGIAIQKQLLRLKEGPRIIVGTPGRVNDHLERRSLSLKNAKILVLDEADRMLDMGFGEQLEAIVQFLPKVRQTFMFSATMPKRILTLSAKFLNAPERIKVGHTHAPLAKIKQDVIRVSEDKKYDLLLKELGSREGSVLIFAKTKRKVDILAKKLNQHMHAVAMHGDLRQHQRMRVLKDFRDQKFRVLVATDVAARGLDVPHIEHVINYDLPQAPEDYIHRIGRTARGGAHGSALCFVSKEDEKYWREIERLLSGDESAPSAYRTPRKDTASKRPARKSNYDSRKPTSKPYAKKRFVKDEGSTKARPSAKSRFAKDEGSRPSAKSRFAKDESSRPSNRSRFADKEDSPFARKPSQSKSRFGDNKAPYAKAKPASRTRAERASDTKTARPNKTKENYFNPRERYDREKAPRAPGKNKFESAAPRDRKSTTTTTRSDGKPKIKPTKMNTKKSYGPQNRPKKKKLDQEES